MSIPAEILETIARLNRELDLIELEATKGLNLIRELIALFPENLVLIQLLATLNNSLLFRDNTKRRVQITLDTISSPYVRDEMIQEAGEDLGELLGRVLETKMLVSKSVGILEELS